MITFQTIITITITILKKTLTPFSGNAYPVIEHPRKQGSLAGTIIKPGYQSHYVCTNNKGMPYPSINETYQGVYDELVINQEAQVSYYNYLLLLSSQLCDFMITFFICLFLSSS